MKNEGSDANIIALKIRIVYTSVVRLLMPRGISDGPQSIIFLNHAIKILNETDFSVKMIFNRRDFTQ